MFLLQHLIYRQSSRHYLRETTRSEAAWKTYLDMPDAT